MKFLILHGTAATPEHNWFRWLEKTLKESNHEVWLPQLPNAEEPDPEKYNSFLLQKNKFVFDKETVIIGHSSGAVAALHLLQNLPENVVIRATILVSVFNNDLGWNALGKLFNSDIDYDIVKEKCQDFIVVHSDDDPYCPLPDAKNVCSALDGRFIQMNGQGHFNTEKSADYTRFPEIIPIIESLKN